MRIKTAAIMRMFKNDIVANISNITAIMTPAVVVLSTTIKTSRVGREGRSNNQSSNFSHITPRQQQQQKQQGLQQKQRSYYYNIDLHGRVFTEDMKPQNITTCLKSKKFLNFFFKNIQIHNNYYDYNSNSYDNNQIMNKENDYPFVSPCGKEMNFIKVADQPFVFQTLEKEDMNNSMSSGSTGSNSSPAAGTKETETETETDNTQFFLTYGIGDQLQPFDPTLLYISNLTGRLYHQIIKPPRAYFGIATTSMKKTTKQKFPIVVGLVKSHLAIELSQNISISESDDGNTSMTFDWKNKSYPIRVLPSEEMIDNQ